MKTLEEKKLLVKMSKMLGQEVDPALVESIKREEFLNRKLFEAQETPVAPTLIVEESPPLSAPAFEPPVKDTVQQVANMLKTNLQPENRYRDAELEGMRRTIAEMMKKISTLSWGGGGTGVVRIHETDDFDKTSYGEGRYLKWSNGMFRLSNVSADVSAATSFGSFLDTHAGDHEASAINTPQMVHITTTDIARGHTLGANNNIVADNTGVYNYQFSLQVTSTTSSKHDIYIWPRINRQDIANSASAFTIASNDGNIIPAWNFVLAMNAGDEFQLMWAVTDLAVKIHGAAAVNGFRPGIPGVILTVTPVGTL